MDNTASQPDLSATNSQPPDPDLIRRTFESLDAELGASRAQADQTELERIEGMSGGDSVVDRTVRSIATGVAKAGFETSDFVFGQPTEADKTDFRRSVEAQDRALANRSAGYGITSGVSQMVTGLIGAGKLLAPVKAAQKLKNAGTAGRALFETGKAAAASAVVLDPHEARLSDLVEEFPALQNPVTEYLASDINDSAAEGRFKNALESIGLDFALLGAVKAIRYLKTGDKEAAVKEIAKLEQARTANADEFGLPAEPSQGGDTVGFASQKFSLEQTFDLPPQQGAEPTNAAVEAAQSVTRPEVAPEVRRNASSPEAAPGDKARDGERTSAALPANEEMPQYAAAHQRIEVTPEAIATILKSTDADLQAIAKYGSREAAAEAGEVLGREARLPWQKLRRSEEMVSFVNSAASVLRNQMDNAKGGDILSDAKVSDMVQAHAEMFGEEPALVMGQLAEAGANASKMVADMEASYLIANRMFQETYDVAFKVRNGMLDDWSGNAEAATRELQARLTASADLMSAARSISANSGRALRRLRGSFQFTPQDLAGIKDLDGQRLAELIYSTKGDPKKLAQVVNPGFLKRVMDEATFSLTNSLLWLYPTHVMNTTSSLYMLAGRPTEKLLGSLAIGPKRGGDILRQQAIKEYVYTVTALSDGWTAMVDAFKRGDSILSPHNTEFFQGGASANTTQRPLKWKPVKGIWDVVENAINAANYRTVVGLPTRTLGAADEFFKTLRYRAYVQAEAATRANAAGLTGTDFREFVAGEMEKAIDPATGQALNRKALQEAQVATFQQELLHGTAGATIQHARSRHPVLTFVVPFVKTPINVLRYGWRMTPGLDLVQKDFRDAFNGKQGAEAQAHAYGQMALGSMFMGLAATLALNGKITGGGPTDPNLRKELAATGWQPYSYVVEGEDGSKRYLPMGRMDPAGMSMSMVANLVDIMRHDPDGGDAELGIGALAMALAKNFADRTFLQNIHQTLEALTDPTARGEKYLGTIAGNAFPLSSAFRGINPDPYLREAQGFIDTMMKNLPGYSETLPPSRDVFGDPIWRRIGLSTTAEADIVEGEHSRIMIETGRGIGKPSPDFHGVDLRDITLTDGRNAYDRFQELAGHPRGAPTLKQALERLITSDTYQDLGDGEAGVSGTRLNALGKIVAKYREAAKKRLLIENRELAQFVGARQKDARAAFLENRERAKGRPGAKELLGALRGL